MQQTVNNLINIHDSVYRKLVKVVPSVLPANRLITTCTGILQIIFPIVPVDRPFMVSRETKEALNKFAQELTVDVVDMNVTVLVDRNEITFKFGDKLSMAEVVFSSDVEKYGE